MKFHKRLHTTGQVQTGQQSMVQIIFPKCQFTRKTQQNNELIYCFQKENLIQWLYIVKNIFHKNYQQKKGQNYQDLLQVLELTMQVSMMTVVKSLSEADKIEYRIHAYRMPLLIRTPP